MARGTTRRRASPFRPTLFWGVAVVAVVGLLWLLPSPQARREAAPAATPTLAPVLAGADVSWPDCRRPGASPSAGIAFGIVGVNDGEPNTRNPCLAEQVAWAAATSGGSAQPRIGYYAIGANPFSRRESKWVKPVWPTSATWQGRRVAIPAAYGADCRGRHTDRACAYVFGWATAWRDAHLAGVVGASTATWWIDVETQRDWAADPLWNQAVVEGMAAYFGGAIGDGGLGARVGVYSNAYFWDDIVGPLRARSPLAALPNWYPIGPATRAEAAAALVALEPVTPRGRIEIVQHVVGGLDRNVAPAGR